MTIQEININPDTRQLILSKGKVAIIDAADYEWLSQWKWHMCHDYAVRNQTAAEAGTWRNRRIIYLHKFIMAAPQEMEVDHINWDRMDNRRSNLRIATRSQNQINTRKIAGCTSKYRGVSKKENDKKWRAQIQVNSKKISLGSFENENEAALAYNNAVLEYFGEFARLNIIE